MRHAHLDAVEQPRAGPAWPDADERVEVRVRACGLVEVSAVDREDHGLQFLLGLFFRDVVVGRVRPDGEVCDSGLKALSEYLADVLARPPEAILPQNIPVSENFLESEEAERLVKEITEADKGVFQDLRTGLKEDSQWWPEVP